MTHVPHHSFFDDSLLRQVIGQEVDERAANLSPEARHGVIDEVSRRLDADIENVLKVGDFTPQHLVARITNEVQDVLDHGTTSA